MTSSSPIQMRLAYQGEPGAYSEQASQEFFDLYRQDASSELAASIAKKPLFVPCASFRDMYEAMRTDRADRAVVPIENSLAGSIHQNLDLLLRYPDLHIVGEYDFRVRHCLLALPGISMDNIKIVRSHYMALAQCDGFLTEHNLISEVAADTAGSAKRIRDDNLTDSGAIAGRAAAKIYGLDIIAENIEDHAKNCTRFLILSKSANGYRVDLPAKTSIAFALHDKPGALFHALSVFAILDTNLTKVESRHIQTVLDALANDEHDIDSARLWNYVFYVDFARSYGDVAVQNALSNLKLVTPFFRLLGSYRRHVTEK